MTPIQANNSRVLDALQEGRASMLITVLPILQPDAVKVVGLKTMFRKTLVSLGWNQSDIDYWSDWFSLTDDI